MPDDVSFIINMSHPGVLNAICAVTRPQRLTLEAAKVSGCRPETTADRPREMSLIREAGLGRNRS